MTQSTTEVSTKSDLNPSDSAGNLASYFSNADHDDYDVQSDFILRSADGKTIKTHKVILATRFRTLEECLRTSPFDDSYNVTIDYPTLKKFVDSLYSRVDFSPSETEALRGQGLEQTSICAVSRDLKLRATNFDSVTIALSVMINILMKVANSAIHGPNNLLSSAETELKAFLEEEIFVEESLMEDKVGDTLMAFLRHSSFSVHMNSQDIVETVLKSHTLEGILKTSAKIRKHSLVHSILSSFTVSRRLKRQYSNFMFLMPSCLVDNLDPFVVVDTHCSRMFGYQPGQENLTGNLHLGIIKELTIYSRIWGDIEVVKGLKILFQDGESHIIGLEVDNETPKDTKKFELHDDEYISYAKGGAGHVLDSLAFVTNKGRQLGPVGGTGGSEFCTLTCRHRKLLKDNRNSAKIVLRGIAALEDNQRGESIITHLQFVTTVICKPGEERLWDDAVL